MRRSRRHRARVWGRASHFWRGWTLRKFSVRPSPVPFSVSVYVRENPVFFRNWFNYWVGPPNTDNRPNKYYSVASSRHPAADIQAADRKQPTVSRQQVAAIRRIASTHHPAPVSQYPAATNSHQQTATTSPSADQPPATGHQPLRSSHRLAASSQ